MKFKFQLGSESLQGGQNALIFPTPVSENFHSKKEGERGEASSRLGKWPYILGFPVQKERLRFCQLGPHKLESEWHMLYQTEVHSAHKKAVRSRSLKTQHPTQDRRTEVWVLEAKRQSEQAWRFELAEVWCSPDAILCLSMGLLVHTWEPLEGD